MFDASRGNLRSLAAHLKPPEISSIVANAHQRIQKTFRRNSQNSKDFDYMIAQQCQLLIDRILPQHGKRTTTYRNEAGDSIFE